MLIKTFKTLRSFIFTTIAKKSIGDMNAEIKANGFTRLTKYATVGNNVNFNGLKILGRGKVEIGDNFHSGFGCLILTGVHNYNGSKIPYDEVTIYKNVKIHDNVWLGINVTILPGVTIGEGAIIQAGSVVVKSIPPYSIAGGHPAIVFNMRNIDSYNHLKRKKKFF